MKILVGKAFYMIALLECLNQHQIHMVTIIFKMINIP